MEQILTNTQALFLIWNTILNQSQPSQKTLESTLDLMNRLGLINDFDKRFCRISFDDIYTEMTKKPLVHRFYNQMSTNLYMSVKHILKRYSGQPSSVFHQANEENVTNNLLGFRGIGLHKANIAYMIFDSYIQTNKEIDFNFTHCPSLEKTLVLELEVLDTLL